jgi:hypothetical protein
VSKNLGHRTRTGVANADNPVSASGWTVTFDPAYVGIQVPFEIYHIAVKGPTSSQFQVFIDTTFYDISNRGDVNSWDGSQPIHVQPGQTVYFHYNTASSPAPVVSIFCREVSPI